MHEPQSWHQQSGCIGLMRRCPTIIIFWQSGGTDGALMWQGANNSISRCEIVDHRQGDADVALMWQVGDEASAVEVVDERQQWAQPVRGRLLHARPLQAQALQVLCKASQPRQKSLGLTHHVSMIGAVNSNVPRKIRNRESANHNRVPRNIPVTMHSQPFAGEKTCVLKGVYDK